MIHREVLIFWCLNSVRWKKSCLSRFCQNCGLAPDWLNRTWRKESPVVCQCLLMSVCAWCSFVNELGICGNILGYIDMFQYVLGAQWGSGVCLRAHSMRDPVWLETNQPNLVQHQKARLFSPDAFKTSKYQNLPMYHFQKWLGFSILCDFDTCHKEITIDSLIGSPCSSFRANKYKQKLKIKTNTNKN